MFRPRLALEYVRRLLRAIPWRRRSPPTTFALQAGDYSTGSPTFDKPPAKRVHHVLKARELDLVLSFPGDSVGEQQAREFLYRTMIQYPTGQPGKTRADFERECCEQFNISKREFARLWEFAIAKSGATAYGKPGPRGPHSDK